MVASLSNTELSRNCCNSSLKSFVSRILRMKTIEWNFTSAFFHPDGTVTAAFDSKISGADEDTIWMQGLLLLGNITPTVSFNKHCLPSALAGGISFMLFSWFNASGILFCVPYGASLSIIHPLQKIFSYQPLSLCYMYASNISHFSRTGGLALFTAIAVVRNNIFCCLCL